MVTGPDGLPWFTGGYQQDPSSPIVYVVGRATPLAVTPASLPAATVGKFYSQSFAVSRAIASYRWSATSVPRGLFFSTEGLLSGIPTAVGAYALEIMVQDSSTPPIRANVSHTLDAEELT